MLTGQRLLLSALLFQDSFFFSLCYFAAAKFEEEDPQNTDIEEVIGQLKVC